MPDTPEDRAAVPVEPVPVEPLPVEALPGEPAWPTADLAYRRPGAPGIVAALGVCSIVVAAIALFAGVATTTAGAFAFSFHAMRHVAAAAANSALQTAVPASQAEVVDPAGLDAAARAAIAQGLSRVRPLTPDQARQLDELLATDGQQVMGTVAGGPAPDPATVAAGVSGSGQLGSLGTAPVGPDQSLSFFLLGNGRLELTDDRAVFFPTDGQPAIRAVAYELPPLPANAAAAPALSDDNVISVLRAIARHNGGRPKAAQLTALIALLRGPAQQVVVPTTDGTDPAGQVLAANTGADGSLDVTTRHASTVCTVSVTPDGRASAIQTAAFALPTGPAANGLAFEAMLFAAAAQACLAIYLLVIGILTLRRARSARTMHWFYVGLKVPVAIAAAAATEWLWRSMGAGGSGSPSPWTVPALVGLAYPVALPFMLTSAAAREYYRRA